jgi:hypothetical protein
MIRIASAMAAAAILAPTAFAQSTVPQGQSAVPQGQSICKMGYAKASKDGLKDKISPVAMKIADKNGDGKISRSEFRAACVKRLFREMHKAS